MQITFIKSCQERFSFIKLAETVFNKMEDSSRSQLNTNDEVKKALYLLNTHPYKGCKKGAGYTDDIRISDLPLLNTANAIYKGFLSIDVDNTPSLERDAYYQDFMKEVKRIIFGDDRFGSKLVKLQDFGYEHQYSINEKTLFLSKLISIVEYKAPSKNNIYNMI